jgi:hypothetical protein
VLIELPVVGWVQQRGKGDDNTKGETRPKQI